MYMYMLACMCLLIDCCRTACWNQITYKHPDDDATLDVISLFRLESRMSEHRESTRPSARHRHVSTRV